MDDKVALMGRVGYSSQRVELMRSLAESMPDERTRHTILRLADEYETRARHKAAALELIRDRFGFQ